MPHHVRNKDNLVDNMDKSLLQLIRISNTVGKEPALTQGGGGNTSLKTDSGRSMYIKASGTSLKDMNEQKGWRRLRLDSVISILQDESIVKLDTFAREVEVVRRLLGACDDGMDNESRPSVEAHLHAFGDNCVLHLHPAAVLAYACAKDGQKELQELFKNVKPAPLWVPYADPGYNLAVRLTKLLAVYEDRFGCKPVICFLEKHGLLISVDSVDTALQILDRVVDKCSGKLVQLNSAGTKPPDEKSIGQVKHCIESAYLEAKGRKSQISYFYSDTIAGFWHLKQAESLLEPGALTPDEQLYSHGPAMWIDKCDAGGIAKRLKDQLDKGAKPSVAFLVKGVGLFVVATKKMAFAIKEVVESSLFIRSNAIRMGGIRTLNEAQQRFINQWEPDVFRKKLVDGTEK